MSFGSILGTLLIGPLKLVFELIFQFGMMLTSHPGLSIIFLSLAMNILVLPLYRRADAMQEQSRDVENKLRDGVSHIKKTFSGDERMMILQAYYRQNNYKPTDVLNGSVSLLLEIPFFMAAYQFLSHLEPLNGVSFGPIADLGAPDGLITIAGFTINLLPVIMTVINVVSSAIYLKGFPLKTKIQLYGMAAFFLVFLWTSPAGLVFYWTLNNVFSLVKNIFYKLKNPRLVIDIMMSISGMCAVILGVFDGKLGLDIPSKPVILIGAVLVLIPTISVIKAGFKTASEKKRREVKPSRAMFVLGALFLTIFIGVFIPSNFIADSPQEFVDLSAFYHPLNYVLYSLCMAAGTFLIWCGVFYWLANDKWKKVFEYAVVALSVIFTVNYMFFGTKLGIISANLVYEEGLIFTLKEVLINIGAVAVIALAVYFLVFKLNRAAKAVVLTAAIALGVMSGLNAVDINKSVDAIKVTESEDFPTVELSRDGKNVVVIMLDRAMNEYIPYLFAEKPELYEMFDGFTYYSNTISFGGHTNFGAPPMLGGYEYTPVEMNKRDEESLKDKYNEAAKVMPYIFLENDYNVTLFDVPYCNYSYISDLSIYDERPEINKYMTEGMFGTTTDEQREYKVSSLSRNFFCFSMMKSLPLAMQSAVYNGGLYNQAYVPASGSVIQTLDGTSKSSGLNQNFMEPYEVLNNLDVMTTITDDGKNNFFFMYNDAPHEPMLTQTPDYTPSEVVDNTEYDAAH
ncbi:MAG: YidC/Oxa1 family membrane protein insertase, partial [Clostridia bacterium]|nr:YidC/Oxa1 family membrane protein insertase [Clostridia bacterium]